MSSTPLIEAEQFTSNRARMEQFTTYQDYESEFQGWKAHAELQFETKTGELRRYWIQFTPAGEGRQRTVDVDGRGKFFEKVESFTIQFSGYGATPLDEARSHLDTLGIAFEHAKELQRRLDAGEIKAPELTTMNKNLDLMEGQR